MLILWEYELTKKTYLFFDVILLHAPDTDVRIGKYGVECKRGGMEVMEKKARYRNRGGVLKTNFPSLSQFISKT